MTPAERFKFGPFEADARTGELFRKGVKVSIQRKPFELLLMLLERAGDLVTREELHQKLWPNTFVQKDLSLNTAIRKLRLALADRGKPNRYIETVGSRGYRFVHTVTPETAAGAGSVNATRIAILPLENLSSAENDLFTDGLTEQLIAQVGRIGAHLSVIAPVSSMQFKRTTKGASQICSELHCDYILSGSVMRNGHRLRVTARLLRGSDQMCLWTDSYARDEADVFEIQDRISAEIANALVRALPTRSRLKPRAIRTENPASYEKYLRATALAGRWVEEDVQEAVRLFNEVIAAEPDFPLAHGDLARLYAGTAPFTLMPPDRLFALVTKHAEAALAGGREIEAAHVALGWKALFYDLDYDQAERQFRRALAINASCAIACAGSSQLFTCLGRHAEAIREIARARELDPVSPFVIMQQACTFCFAERYEEGERASRDALGVNSTFALAHGTLAWSLAGQGKLRDAVQAAQQACNYAPLSPLLRATYLYCLGLADRSAAKIELQSTLAQPDGVAMPSYWTALVYAAVGELELSLDWLERSIRQREAWRSVLKVDPRLKPVAKHGRFRAILRQLSHVVTR